MGISRVAGAAVMGALVGVAAVLSVAAAAVPEPEITPAAVEVEGSAPEPLERGGYSVEVETPAAEPVESPAAVAPEPVAPVAPVAPAADPVTAGDCLTGGERMWQRGGVCETIPSEWDAFTTGDVLVCGTGAKPALDYREDVGWWAYCEPALVD